MADPAPAPAPAAPAPAAPAAPAANQPWYQGVEGVDPEIVGYFQTKGLDRKTPAEAAVLAAKAAREAERFVGIPTAQLLRFPKDAADEAGWTALHTRLGRPADAKGYDLAAVKRADGTPLDEASAEFYRTLAFKQNMPKDAAPALVAELVKREESAAASAAVERTAKLAEEKAKLATNWGPQAIPNMEIAKRGAAALGITPEEVAALEGVIGYAKTMEAMRRVGVLGKEDAYFTSTGKSGDGIMTREQAASRKAELMADNAWRDSYLNGDAAKRREMEGLNRMLSS